MPLSIGVVGVGYLGIHHVRCLSLSSHADLVGVYEHHADRAERAVAYGARVFSDLESLLAEVEAVVVSTPTQAHLEVASKALERGLHCFVEKPLASSLEECDRLIAAAERYGCTLHVGHVERMNPAVRAARSRIRRPRFIEVHRLAGFAPRGVDVDVLLDLMIHDLDLVLDWTGQEPETVSAVGVSVMTGKVDIANARLEFPDGCVANLTASRVSQEKMRKIRVFQEECYLSLDCVRGVTVIVEADREALAQVLAGLGSEGDGPVAPADPTLAVRRRELPAEGGEPIALELDAFLQTCLGVAPSGGGAPADGHAGRRAVALATEVRRSLEERAQQWQS